MNVAFLQKPDVQQFIQTHLEKDVNNLLLNPPKEFSSEETKWIADQIQARQKAKGKLPSWTKNHSLIFPPPLSSEQASSEVTANYKASLLNGELLIDLTGGTGIDLLAISKNFEQAVYVEQQKWLTEVFDKNCQVLNRSIEIHNQTCEQFLETFKNSSDSQTTFFLDPARRDTNQRKVFRLEDCSPNVVELVPILKEKSKKVMIKLAPLLDIKEALSKLDGVKEVHVVSVKNDCKELLFLLDFSYQDPPKINAVNLETSDSLYSFSYEEENSAQASISSSGKYIYEPNTSILKAGAFQSIALDFGVNKIASNTHLYTSPEVIAGWPGRTFEVIETSVNKKSIGRYLENGCINVLTRNYPLNANELKRKFQLKDGGSNFLLGFRDNQNKAQLVAATKIDQSAG